MSATQDRRCPPLWLALLLWTVGIGCNGSDLPQVDFSAADSKTIQSLTASERATFTDEAMQILLQVFSNQNMCCRAAANQQRVAAGWDATHCQTEYDRCMQDFDAYPGHCTVTFSIEMDSCAATVAQVQTCFNEAVQSGEQFYSNISCTHSEGKFLGGPSPPPSCTEVGHSCPPVPHVELTYVPN